jgi:hypothetical protein
MLGHDDALVRGMTRPAPRPTAAPPPTKPVKTGSLETGESLLDAQLAQAGEPPEPEALPDAG